jgi:L-amino acid N-acyltransferase YncA
MTTIRLADADDAAQVAAIYAPYVHAAATSFEIDAPGAEEMRERILRTLSRVPWLVCARDAEVLGYAYAGKHRDRAAYQWSVDVSVYVDARAQRRGVGRALYTSLLRLLVVQGYYNAYAGITLPNPSSVGLHEALGFQPVGIYREVGHKLGAWHDVGWWSLRLQALTSDPPPPSDPSAVRGSEAWKAALVAGVPLLRIDPPHG